jgi:hypothetical protein
MQMILKTTSRLLMCLSLYGCSAALPGAALVRAQSTSGAWSTPALIASTDGTLAATAMTLLEDSHGNLHLLFPHRPTEDQATAIDHMLWNGESWSPPNTVLVDAHSGEVTYVRGAVTKRDRVVLVWEGWQRQVFFASAPASAAGDAKAWSRPTALGVAVTHAGIAVSPDGTIWVAYADAERTGRIALVGSTNEGLTWSNPRGIVERPEGTVPSRISLAADEGGILHMTWTDATLPNGEPLTGVFYSRSLDGGRTWEEPTQFDGLYHGEIGVGLGPNHEVHVAWRSNIGGDGTFHEWSSDGGASWSPPDQTPDRGGISGLPSFGIDSSGTLYVVIGPALVAIWAGGELSPWLDVATEQLRTNANQDSRWTGPERAVLALRNGNEVHVVFETGFNKLWHTYRRLDLPAVRRTPFAAPTQKTSAKPTVSASPTVAASPAAPVTAPETRVTPSPGRNAMLGIAVGSLTAALVVSVVAMVQWIRRGR